MFVRKLNKDDWNAYKAIRLEALRLHENLYGGSYAAEAAYSDQDWQDLIGTKTYAFFGLYDDDKIVGSTVVFTHRDDPTGKTALLAGSYIRKEYRGMGLSRKLYEARLDWIKSEERFERVWVGHRAGNEASRRANQAFGFTLLKTEDKAWGDGSKDTYYHYELRIK
jgi:RimJ/RimL family protein N-acetyltransferase